MTHEIRTDEATRLALVQLKGSITGEEIVQAAHALYSEQGWNGRWDVIWDGRRIEELLVDLDDIDTWLQIGKTYRHPDSPPIVIIVQRDLDSMIAELYEKMAQGAGRKVEVTWTMKAALKKLGRKELPDGLKG